MWVAQWIRLNIHFRLFCCSLRQPIYTHIRLIHIQARWGYSSEAVIELIRYGISIAWDA